jgi:hypothetical protein
VDVRDPPSAVHPSQDHRLYTPAGNRPAFEGPRGRGPTQDENRVAHFDDMPVLYDRRRRAGKAHVGIEMLCCVLIAAVLGFAGFVDRHVRGHQLQHRFAAIALERGVPPVHERGREVIGSRVGDEKRCPQQV